MEKCVFTSNVSQHYIIINKYTRHGKDAECGFKIRIIYMKKMCNCIIFKSENTLINKCWWFTMCTVVRGTLKGTKKWQYFTDLVFDLSPTPDKLAGSESCCPLYQKMTPRVTENTMYTSLSLLYRFMPEKVDTNSW